MATIEDQPPISAYALLSDSQGSALVSRAGSIDWACFPRFDAPSVFGRLLDPRAGHWSLHPTSEFESDRAYIENTLVLRTVFRTPGGTASVTDAMPFGPGERGHSIGFDSPHAIVRIVEGIEGEVVFDHELVARPEYGLVVPVLTRHERGVRARGGVLGFDATIPEPFEVDTGVVTSRLRVGVGETRRFAIVQRSPWRAPAPALGDGEIDELLRSTIEGWRSWVGLHQNYHGPYAEHVAHSGRVLQALTYAPTGAIIAAPTTSLPEVIGGMRNWDYRYSWVRDTSLTLEALWIAACPDEATRFFAFFAIAAGDCSAPDTTLQIMYGVEGERHLAEQELGHLAGYRASRPVRIGNGAWNQSQLDVYGELLGAACILADQLGKFDVQTASFLVDMVDTAAARWREPDQGIWEVRGEPQHFLHSKVMCWVALDRALRLGDHWPFDVPADRWQAEREAIRDAILSEGWSEKVGAFTQAFGSDVLDASALTLAIVGFLPATDPRMSATIDAIDEQLTDDHGFVYRYQIDDGLQGEEGAFVLCTFWLVQCLAKRGETVRARALFEKVLAHTNDVGLLSEEIDSATGEFLGNFPQAFTHVGLINAAYAISEAEARPDPKI